MAVRTSKKPPTKLTVVPEPKGRVQVHAAVDGMRIEVLRCRANQHNWDPFDADIKHYDDGSTDLVEVQLCPRCGTYKHHTMTVYGAIVRSHYDYPKDYLLDGLGRLTTDERNMIRLATFNYAMTAKTVRAAAKSS